MDFFELLAKNFAISLNEQQKAAVSHVGGPALVLAGPGSGKTTVITARAAYLCLEAGVNPRRILTMTFSRAAAREMRTRFDRVYGDAVGQRMRFSTIHSFCNRVLRDYEERQGQKFRLIESEDEEVRKEHILRGIYQSVNDMRPNDDELETLSGEIGLVKNRMIRDPEAFETVASTRNFAAIYKAYEDFKRENLYIDYDDMLSYAFLILRKCPDICCRYQHLFEYIQVDEGQDLSKIQFEILNLLLDGKRQNLLIVADDDQSIYAFRGAEPEQILRMKERYAGCAIFKLETNYRSSRNIVELSSRFIRKNQRRFDKNHNTENGEAEDPRFISAENETGQLRFLLQQITQLQCTCPGDSIAVIYRSNLSSLSLVDTFERRGCAFKIRQSRLHVFSHWVVQDVRALLRFSMDQMDAEAFERICYKIKRYVSKAMMEFAGKTYYKESFINALAAFPGMQPFQIRNLKDLIEEFRKLSVMKPAQALDAIETTFNYGEYMRDYCDKSRTSYAYVCNIFGILKTVAANYETISDFTGRLDVLDAMLQNREPPAKTNLTFTTMHSSKGLEFDHVFMIDLTNDEIPGMDMEDAENDAAVEEERRLFYVGMTRARETLTLVYPKFRGGVPQQRSAFLNEVAACLRISEQTADGIIGEGVILEHKSLGTGVVESVERKGDHIYLLVSFGGEVKKLDYALCRQNGLLSIVD